MPDHLTKIRSVPKAWTENPASQTAMRIRPHIEGVLNGSSTTVAREMCQACGHVSNRISGLLMEAGADHNNQRLDKVDSFRELMATSPKIRHRSKKQAASPLLASVSARPYSVYEYLHGENGAGMRASDPIGLTGTVAGVMDGFGRIDVILFSRQIGSARCPGSYGSELQDTPTEPCALLPLP